MCDTNFTFLIFSKGAKIMSYTEEIYNRVVAQNPGEPEFHQAVKEVLDSLKLVIDANEENIVQSACSSVSLSRSVLFPSRFRG